MSDYFHDELRFLGIQSSPTFVREPEGNGCGERFIRTLKEQVLWVRGFETVEELRLALVAFQDRYNLEWLTERHGYSTRPSRRIRGCWLAPWWRHEDNQTGVQEIEGGTV